jgi:nitroreductase
MRRGFIAFDVPALEPYPGFARLFEGRRRGMNLWEALEARATVRTFDARPVAAGVVTKAIRAALHAPAYNHLWEWGFIQIHNRALRTSLADAVGLEDVSDPDTLATKFAALPAEARQIYLRALPVQRTMVLTAPGLLVPVYRPKRGERAPQGPADLNAHAAIWIALGYLLLSLAEDGVYGCTIIPGRSSEARRVLGVPEDWEIATLLPFGYPRGRVVRNEHPSEVDAFLHVDRFGGFHLPTTPEPMG